MGRVASSRGVVTSHHPAQGRAAREPSVAVALGWLSRVRGASSSGTNAAGTREPRFGGRHRTSPSRVRCLGGGLRRSGPHSEVRDILISILGHSGPSLYGSGASRVSFDRLAEAPSWCAPRRSARHPAQPTRGRGRHARSSPTKKACNGQPRSRRPPGGRVAT